MRRILISAALAILIASGRVFGSEYVRAEGAIDVARVERACDAIVERLKARYGSPRRWEVFPVRFVGARPGIAGYTSYLRPKVLEVAICQSFEESLGGTLDHELTHAFFFYYLDSNCDLFLNEGAAQNSESRNRARLRATVCARARNGDFLPLDQLYGRNEYDPNLLLYSQGFSVVDFLIARGGSKWFAAFLDDLTNGSQDVGAALRNFYDCESLDALESEWLEYVQAGQDRDATRAVR